MASIMSMVRKLKKARGEMADHEAWSWCPEDTKEYPNREESNL